MLPNTVQLLTLEKQNVDNIMKEVVIEVGTATSCILNMSAGNLRDNSSNKCMMNILTIEKTEGRDN